MRNAREARNPGAPPAAARLTTVVILLAAASRLSVAATPAAGAEPCRPLHTREVASVQAAPVVESKPTARDAGGYAVSDCFYRTEPFERSVSIEVVRASGRASAAAAGSPADRWERMFRAPVEGEGGREGEAAGAAAGSVPEAEGGPRIEREKSPPRPIEGLGQEAFWVGNRASGVLYVLRGDAYLRLSVGGPDTEEAKLKKAIALARKALPRL